MPYVKRDKKGKITGLFRWPVAGVSEKKQERLPDDHPEVVAHKASRSGADAVEKILQNDRVLRPLLAALTDELGKKPRELIEAIKAKV